MRTLSGKKLAALTATANTIRQDIIQMLLAAGSGHSAGPLGMADVFTTLYFHVLNHRPNQPRWPGRDRVVLSNGHICPVLYATLARAGYFSLEELKTLRQLGSGLQGHPHIQAMPGIETSSGPLSQGISQAVGFALAARLQQAPHHTYCLMSDGELNEGQCWEAFLFAAKERLGNLIAVVDRNHIQIDGRTEDVMPLEPLAEKFKSFNWHVQEVDGHNIKKLVAAFAKAQSISTKPSVILARTVPGKGVSFMENDYRWHGKPPNAEEAAKALAELTS